MIVLVVFRSVQDDFEKDLDQIYIFKKDLDQDPFQITSEKKDLDQSLFRSPLEKKDLDQDHRSKNLDLDLGS